MSFNFDPSAFTVEDFAEKFTKKFWVPYPGPQTDFITSLWKNILYGGAKGGGKTACSVHRLYVVLSYFSALGLPADYLKALIVRETHGQLDQIADECERQFVKKGLATMVASNPRKVTFNHNSDCPGARIIFGSMRKGVSGTLQDAARGFEYVAIAVDEISNFPYEKPIDDLMGACRIPHFGRSYFSITANPGYEAHEWLWRRRVGPQRDFLEENQDEDIQERKQVLILPQHGEPVRDYAEDGTFVGYKQVIFATIDDNPAITEEYARSLKIIASGDEETYKGIRWGIWDLALETTAFGKQYKYTTHALDEHSIPKSWKIILAMDYGSASPTAIGAFAISDGREFRDEVSGNLMRYPKGTYICIDELYLADPVKKNVGLELTHTEMKQRVWEWIDNNNKPEVTVNKGVLKRFSYFICDSQGGMFDKVVDDSVEKTQRKSNHDKYWDTGKRPIKMTPATKGGGSIAAGVDDIRTRLYAATWNQENAREHELPALYAWKRCKFFHKFVKEAQLSSDPKKKLEVIGEDHYVDMLRYAMASIKTQAKRKAVKYKTR